MREQLIGGAKVALAFVRVHYPSLDLKVVGWGLPLTPGGRWEMEAHYEAVLDSAESIIQLVENETDNIRQRRGERWTL